jgi:Collagenase and related proteases
VVNGERFHALEEPTSLNTIDLIPQLAEIGVAAVKIEGRQRSPAYVEQVTRVWRQALDAWQRAPENYRALTQWQDALDKLSEGHQTTLGAYHRSWQ